MYLCFIDESGTPPKPTAANPRPYFIIAGVIFHEAQCRPIADELRQLCRRPDFSITKEIKWRFFGPDNKDRENSVGHLDSAKRDEFRKAFFEIISKRKSVKSFAVISSVASAYKTSYVNDEDDLYLYTYKVASERFQYFLQDLTREVGDQQLGIIIADHRGKKQDDLLRSRHHLLVDRQDMFTSTYGNYVETVFMTPSHLSVGIQFADMIAGAIGRAFNSKDRTYFDQIRSTLRRGPNDKIEGYGLAKFPRSGWV